VVDKIKSALWYNRDIYENILDDPNSNIGRFFDLCILVLIWFFPLLLIFESIWNNSIRYWVELLYFDAFVSVAFLSEYIYRFIKAKNKIRFIFSIRRIIDLLSFLPFYLWLVTIWNFLKLLRITRLIRLLKIVKRIPLTDWFVKSLKNYSDEYIAIFTLYGFLLFSVSFFVYYFEKDVIWTQFTSMWLSFWWWIVTMSSVWYWDMAPATDFWKAIWSILVFLGPIMWSLIWAVTIMVFMETSEFENNINKRTRFKECNRCRSMNPKMANFCMKCWEGYYVIHD
jgi:voltage-gated potassium channel